MRKTVGELLTSTPADHGAALAATGQAKLTGRLGVGAGTTGPGATQLLAGLYEARLDHAPVLMRHFAGV